MQSTLMSQGFSLLSVGMSAVLLFLTLLVVLTGCVSRLLARFAPDPVATIAPRAARQPQSCEAPVDAVTRKVIEVALQKHRSRSRVSKS